MSSNTERWKEAWPLLADAVSETALDKFGPFPSLYANDYMHTLKSKGVDAETIKFVKALVRELNWAYDNWCRSALSPDHLLKDICSKVSSLTPGADAFFEIIRNYRLTHNIPDPELAHATEMMVDADDWMRAVAKPPEQTPPP